MQARLRNARFRNAAFGMTVFGMAMAGGTLAARAEPDQTTSQMSKADALKKMKQEFAKHDVKQTGTKPVDEKAPVVMAAAKKPPVMASMEPTASPQASDTRVEIPAAKLATVQKLAEQGRPDFQTRFDVTEQPVARSAASKKTAKATKGAETNADISQATADASPQTPSQQPVPGVSAEPTAIILAEDVRQMASVTKAPPPAPAVQPAPKKSKRIEATDPEVTGSVSGALQSSAPYRDLVQRHAAVHGLPFALADAVVKIESGYNPNAHNAGAIGLMQIMLPTARSLGYDGNAAGLTHPETNIKYGMIYLAQAYKMSEGDTCKTVMRYQSGHLTTRMSAANQAYCSRARMLIAQNNN